MTTSVPRQFYFVSPLVILFFCWALFYLDRETHSVTDLFKPGNLVALLIYFIPTYFICTLLNYMFSKRNNKNSVALSLLIGIPAGFVFVIILLSIWMGRI